MGLGGFEVEPRLLEPLLGCGVDGEETRAHHVGAPGREADAIEYRLFLRDHLVHRAFAAIEPAGCLPLSLEDFLVGRFELGDIVGRQVGFGDAPLGSGQLGARRFELRHRARRIASLLLQPGFELGGGRLQLHELVGQLLRPLGRDELDRIRTGDGVEQDLDRSRVDRRQLLQPAVDALEIDAQLFDVTFEPVALSQRAPPN